MVQPLTFTVINIGPRKVWAYRDSNGDLVAECGICPFFHIGYQDRWAASRDARAHAETHREQAA